MKIKYDQRCKGGGVLYDLEENPPKNWTRAEVDEYVNNYLKKIRGVENVRIIP